MKYGGIVNFQNTIIVYFPVPIISAGILSTGRKCPHQPEIMIAYAAAVGSKPSSKQVAIASGANT